MLKFMKKKSVRLPVVLLLVFTMAFTVMIGWGGSVDAQALDLEQTVAQFPESYQPYIRELKSKHPNWEFVAVNVKNTAVDSQAGDWNYALGKEMYFKRCVVPDLKKDGTPSGMSRGALDKKENGSWSWYPTPTAWKDTDDVYGSYNWWENKWVQLDTGEWCQASKTAVSYVMDPRNWLNEDYVFMFKSNYGFDDSETVDIVNSALAGTFMCNAVCPGSSAKYGSDVSYAQVLYDAGKAYGVSAVHLATRLVQEKGQNPDALANGVTINGVKYYNYFNIGASGSGQEEVINNGVKEAMNANPAWTSPYLAIDGGAKKISANYTNGGRDTLYFQKFNVLGSFAPYMQNLLAPLTEGTKLHDTYLSNGVFDNRYIFRIPVYENMPESPCPVPMGPSGNYRDTSNPNNKLASFSFADLSGNGISFTPTFNTDYTGTDNRGTYYAKVPYGVEALKINAAPIAGTSSVYIASGAPLDNVPLEVGDNVIDVVCKSQYGTTRTYRITVNRSTTDTGFELNELQTNNTYINGFSIGDTVSTAVGRMIIDSERGVIKILNSAKQEKPGDALICTGDYVDVCKLDGTVDMEYPVVLYGDVNGDGKADLFDYAIIKKHCWSGGQTLGGIGLEAANVYPASQDVDIFDMAVFKKYMWGSGAISQRR